MIAAWCAVGAGGILLAAGAWLDRREQDQTMGKRAGRIRTRE